MGAGPVVRADGSSTGILFGALLAVGVLAAFVIVGAGVSTLSWRRMSALRAHYPEAFIFGGTYTSDFARGVRNLGKIEASLTMYLQFVADDHGISVWSGATPQLVAAIEWCEIVSITFGRIHHTRSQSPAVIIDADNHRVRAQLPIRDANSSPIYVRSATETRWIAEMLAAMLAEHSRAA